MKVGALVKCIWQPRSAGLVEGELAPMKHIIKGELGIIIDIHEGKCSVLFPRYGYVHLLSINVLEEIS